MTWAVVATLVLGFGSGILAGMFGIGGAVVTTPGIRVLGASPIQAVGSTVPAILPGSISGAYRYAKSGLVDWRVGLVCGASGTACAVGGAWLSHQVNAHYLMILTAGLLAFTGVSLLRTGSPSDPPPDEGDAAEHLIASDPRAVDPPGVDDPVEARGESVRALAPARPHPGLIGLVVVGACSGGLAGLLGVGGGIIMVPAFTRLLRLPMKLAVGSSLVAVAIFSVPGLLEHMHLGDVSWRFAVPLVIGVVPGAQVGARVTLGSSDAVIRRAFGAFVLVVAVIYAISEIRAL